MRCAQCPQPDNAAHAYLFRSGIRQGAKAHLQPRRGVSGVVPFRTLGRMAWLGRTQDHAPRRLHACDSDSQRRRTGHARGRCCTCGRTGASCGRP